MWWYYIASSYVAFDKATDYLYRVATCCDFLKFYYRYVYIIICIIYIDYVIVYSDILILFKLQLSMTIFMHL